jgi:hypothetical protein
MLSRSKHELPNHFHTSLEEAAVSRPGPEAGIKNGQTLRAPKVRHRNDAGRVFHSFSNTMRHGGPTWREKGWRNRLPMLHNSKLGEFNNEESSTD